MTKDGFQSYRKIEEEENKVNQLQKLSGAQFEPKIQNRMNVNQNNTTAQSKDPEQDLKERIQRVLEDVIELKQFLEEYIKLTKSEEMRGMLKVALAIYRIASRIDDIKPTQQEEIQNLERATYKLNKVLNNYLKCVIRDFVDTY
ncbi:MAG: hypothetical protein NZ908_02340 [Candidatus Micrarchaeota archaeon]|nr:hypothetical protein [Candidatus Micrarchaeota archaeon]MCX8154339.1 hypothetical protein [Candidatus Micrarchaeota archaeon]